MLAEASRWCSKKDRQWLESEHYARSLYLLIMTARRTYLFILVLSQIRLLRHLNLVLHDLDIVENVVRLELVLTSLLGFLRDHFTIFLCVLSWNKGTLLVLVLLVTTLHISFGQNVCSKMTHEVHLVLRVFLILKWGWSLIVWGLLNSVISFAIENVFF